MAQSPHTGASGSGHTLVPEQNFSLLLKVKSCAEFVSLSKVRVAEYEKQVRMSHGLCPWCIFYLFFPRYFFLHLMTVTYLGFLFWLYGFISLDWTYFLFPAGENEEHNSFWPDDHWGLEWSLPRNKIRQEEVSLLASPANWEFIKLGPGGSSGPYIISSGHCGMT